MERICKISVKPMLGLIIFVLFISSCGEPCIDGNGRIRTEAREINGFTNITMLGDFDIYIEQSAVYEVIVEGDENLLPYVQIEKRSTNTLEIRNANNRCLRSSQPIRVTIKSPDVFRVTNGGSGYIRCDNVFNDEFEVILSGSGEIECFNMDTYDLLATLSGSGKISLDGEAIGSEMELSGSGKIDAFDLNLDECYITISGSGDAYVFVMDYLNVSIPGSGSVFYSGNPTTVVKRIDGSGSVIRR